MKVGLLIRFALAFALNGAAVAGTSAMQKWRAARLSGDPGYLLAFLV